jgi:uncharacterized protein
VPMLYSMEPVKLVVAGPAGAGKSTLVRAIADLTVRSTDPSGVDFDLGRITIGRDLVLYLYGSPAEPEHDGWKALSQGMLGSIVVIDALRPDGPVRASPHIEWFGGQDAPMLVAANRCPPEATDVVARELAVPPDAVVSIDVSTRSEVRDLVIKVLELALAATTPSAVSLEIQARLG